MSIAAYNIKERYKKLLKEEKGTIIKNHACKITVVLAFPNLYSVGMSNLGLHKLYFLLNSMDSVLCERVFLPGPGDLIDIQKNNIPLFSLESRRPVKEFDILAFSVPFELDYINIVKILSLSHIPPNAVERTSFDPFVIAGGVGPTCNPEPIADFMDAVVIGEGEIIVEKIASLYSESSANHEALKDALSGIAGIYIPSQFSVAYNSTGYISDVKHKGKKPISIRRKPLAPCELTPTVSVITTPNTIFDNTFLVEVERGCPMRCRFCAGGNIYRNHRQYNFQSLKEEIERGMTIAKKVGLVGMAIGSYGELDKMCDFLIGRKAFVSVSSLRIDTVSESLFKLFQHSGLKTITFAPETGTYRLRKNINKNITDEHICDAVNKSFEHNILNVKLYFIIGLPGERDTDILGIIYLIKKIYSLMLKNAKVRKRIGTLSISINPFIPKANTPFQRERMDSLTNIKKKIRQIRREVGKCGNIRIICESLSRAFLQAALSSGDRRLGEVLISLSRGEDMNASFLKCKLEPEFYTYRIRDKDEPLPWDHLNR